RMAFPIPHDQHVDFIGRIATFTGLLDTATALARRATQRARALVRTAHDCLVGFSDAGQMFGLHSRRSRQKSVAPAKGCVAMYASPSRRLAHGLAIDQCLSKYTPGRALAQTGQRCARQHVECASTGM